MSSAAALDAALASLLEPYRREYQDQVFDCLKQQGGLQACSLAFYQERDMGNDGVWDNWRLEGPVLTWFFRGSPHVHIWIHVAQDPKAADLFLLRLRNTHESPHLHPSQFRSTHDRCRIVAGRPVGPLTRCAWPSRRTRSERSDGGGPDRLR